MATIPLKSQYGPTLGRLLAPRWHAAGRVVRGTVIASGIGLVALAIGAFLTLEPARISYGGATPFHFSYRGLYRTAPAPGGYVQVQRRRTDGWRTPSRLRRRRLPPYAGGLSGELPLYASSYIRGLSEEYRGFVLRGEGKTRVNTVPAYNVFYTVTLQGREMYGRDVLLLPERQGVRNGVAIEMLSSPTANSQVISPLEVASAGVLERPLKTFTFD